MNPSEEGAAPASPTFLRSRTFRRFAPPGALALLPTILVLIGAGGSFTLWGSDMITGSYHIRGLVGQLLREGRLPVWDPHTMCGFPLLAAMQAGVLYPPTWPAAFLDPGPFWTATVLLHLILAGQFAFGWLNRGLRLGAGAGLVGACAFMLSGYILTRVLGGHISQICAYPWLAAVLWRTERYLHRPTVRRWILLAASVALLILPGFPQYVLFAAAFMLVRLAAYRVRAGRAGMKTASFAAAAGTVGGLFCAPQILATLELLPEAQRVAGMSYEFATFLSVPWQHLLALLAPSFFGSDLGTPYWSRGAIWEVTGFVGIAGLVLGALALKGSHPQRWFWFAVAGLTLVLALGSETPVFKIFYHVMPGAKLFRQPGRYLAVFTVALSALAALGFDRWWKDGADVRKSARAAAIGAVVVLGSFLITLAIWGKSAPGEQGGWERFVAERFRDPECLASDAVKRDPGFPETARLHARTSLGWASLTLGIIAVCLFAYSRGSLRARTGAVTLGTLLVVELVAFGHGFLRGYDARLIAWPPDFVSFVKGAPGSPYRLASPGRKGLPHVGKCQLARLDHVAGYESLMLRRYCELINVIHGRPPDMIRLASTVDTPHPVLDMLGARFWLVPEGLQVPPGWRAIGKVSDGSGDYLVLDSPYAFPRAYFVPESVTIPSREERLKVLTAGGADLTKVVVLEKAAVPSPPAGTGSARVTSFAAGEYEIATEATSDGFLVLTETYYPGWEARVDGAPVEILRANHLVQAVRIPAGKHTVRFEYSPTRLQAGMLISLAIALAVLGTVGVRRFSSRARGGQVQSLPS